MNVGSGRVDAPAAEEPVEAAVESPLLIGPFGLPHRDETFIDYRAQRHPVFPHALLRMLNMRQQRRRQGRTGDEGLQGVPVHHRGRARLTHEIEQRTFLQQYHQMRGIEGQRALQRIEFGFRALEHAQRRGQTQPKGQVSRRHDDNLLEQGSLPPRVRRRRAAGAPARAARLRRARIQLASPSKV